MAIPADTVWQVQIGGNDAQCGGGFSPSTAGGTGADLTQSNTAAAVTGVLTASGTTITDANAVFLATHKGNTIQISGVGIFMIMSVVSASQIVVDRAPGTIPGTARGYIGGAFASPGQAASVKVDGNTVYMQGPVSFNILTAIANVSTGRVVDTTSGVWAGYSTDRSPLSTDDISVTLAGNLSSDLFTAAPAAAGAKMLISGMVFNNSGPGHGIYATSPATRYQTSLFNCRLSASPAVLITDCILVKCQGSPDVTGCILIGHVGQNATFPATLDQTSVLIDCIIDWTNSTAANVKFAVAMGCDFTGNGGVSGANMPVVGTWAINSIFSNSPKGSSFQALLESSYAICSAAESVAVVVAAKRCVTIAGDPYTNYSGGDYSLGSSGAGPTLKGVGLFGAFPTLPSSVGAQDIGAVQSGAGGGGGGGLLVPQGDGEMDEYLAGSTSVIEKVRLLDSTKTDGSGKTGLAYNTSGLVCWYKRSNGGAPVGVTLANITTLGTYASGGFKEISAANMPGEYEFHPPDAAMAAGAKWVEFTFSGPAGMAQRTIRYRLVAFNPDNGNNLGLTYLVQTSDPLATPVPGSYPAGSAGFRLGYLDAAITSRSTYAGGDTPGTTTLLGKVGNPANGSLAADIAQVETHAANSDTQSAAAATKAAASYNILVADEYTDRSGSPWKRVLVQQGTGDLTTGVRLLEQRLYDTAGAPVTTSTQVIGAAFV